MHWKAAALAALITANVATPSLGQDRPAPGGGAPAGRSSCQINGVDCETYYRDRYSAWRWIIGTEGNWGDPGRQVVDMCLPEGYIICGISVNVLEHPPSDTGYFHINPPGKRCSLQSQYVTRNAPFMGNASVKTETVLYGYTTRFPISQRDIEAYCSDKNKGPRGEGSNISHSCSPVGIPGGGGVEAGLGMCTEMEYRADGSVGRSAPFPCSACIGYSGSLP